MANGNGGAFPPIDAILQGDQPLVIMKACKLSSSRLVERMACNGSPPLGIAAL